MNMDIKHFILFITCMMVFFSGYTQNLNILFKAGWEIGVNNTYYPAVSYKIQNFSTQSAIYTHKLYQFAYGKGIQTSLGIEMRLGNHLEFCLDFQYHASPDNIYQWKQEYYQSGYYGNVLKLRIKDKTTQKASSFSWVPSIKISIPTTSNNLYGKIGLVAGLFYLKEINEVDIVENMDEFVLPNHVDSEFKYKNRLCIGFMASTGYDIHLSDHWDLATEAGFSFTTYAPRSARYTSYIEDGKEAIDNLKTFEREVVFVKNYNTVDNTGTSNPTKMLRLQYAFNHIFFRLGIKYKFIKG